MVGLNYIGMVSLVDCRTQTLKMETDTDMTSQKTKFTLSSTKSSVIKDEYFYEMKLELYMELSEPEFTSIYMIEAEDEMYWLVNFDGDLPDPCANIGEDSAYMAISMSGAAAVTSSDVCPLNSDTYKPITFDTSFYTAKIVNDFQIYVYSSNVDTDDVGIAKIIHLTLKSKGWCDDAHTKPAKKDTDCDPTSSSAAVSSSAA